MLSFLKVVFCLAVVLGVASAAITVESGVLVLDDSNFAEATALHNEMLVEFYAPWCGHCKTLAPEWAKAAKALSASPIKLAKVDATIAKKLAETHGIEGFPTIKYFKNGKSTEYNGGRVEKEIVAWVNKKSGPSFQTVTTKEEILSLQEGQDSFVIGAFAKIDSDAAKAFISMASDADDQVYALTTSPDVLNFLAVKEDTVIVMKSFDDLRNDMSVEEEFEVDDVESFILASSTPLVAEFSQESAKKIFRSEIQKHALLFTDKNSAEHSPAMEALKKVAVQNKGKAIFVNVPTTETRVYSFFDITTEDVPSLILADMGAESGMKKYPYTGPMEAESINAFLTDFYDGKLEAFLKSEEVLPEDATGAVIIAKGKSFEDIVINNTKDVLVEFYAPWCGHCKTLAPIWDSLGMKYKGNDNISIVKMDASANEIDVPGVSVKGFPTIYFFKGDDKANPIKYEEGRELKDFVKYLSSNSHNKHEEL